MPAGSLSNDLDCGCRRQKTDEPEAEGIALAVQIHGQVALAAHLVEDLPALAKRAHAR